MTRESVICICGSECFCWFVLVVECLLCLDRCEGMVAVYFLVKRCSLLYLYAGNGVFLPPPYLDIHGEIDISLGYVLAMS